LFPLFPTDSNETLDHNCKRLTPPRKRQARTWDGRITPGLPRVRSHANVAIRRKANLADIPEEESVSPPGKFHTFDKPMNEAIGGDPRSNDLTKRWPFAVELTRLPAGASNCP